MKCKVINCDKKGHAKTLCAAHYLRMLRYGDPMGGRRPLVRDWEERVNKNGAMPEYNPKLGSCWIWEGRTKFGYGLYQKNRKIIQVHRLSYERYTEPIPKGLVIDHLCRVRHCCNPKHLEAVTHKENDRRGYGASGINGRKTHCIRGHEFNKENTFKTKTGARRCITCYTAWHKAYYLKRKAAKV